MTIEDAHAITAKFNLTGLGVGGNTVKFPFAAPHAVHLHGWFTATELEAMAIILRAATARKKAK